MWRLQEKSDRDVASHLYEEYLMKKALAEVGDLKIGGRIINKMRLADYTPIKAKPQEELQDMKNRLVVTGSMAWKSTSTNQK